jgi:hypothetical protein
VSPPNDRGQPEAERDPLQDDGVALRQPQVLEEEDDLEPLAVDGGEAEQREAGADRHAAAADERAPATVMVGDPAGPVDAVEEPVHDHQQERHRDQAGRRLEVEAGPAQGADQPGGDEPGEDRGGERRAGAGRDRPAPDAVGAEQAGADRRQHQHRL